MSINALVCRVKQLGIIPEASYRSFCMHASQSGLRKEEPGTWARSESASRFRQLVHRASGQYLITRSKAAGLLRVTLQEFDEQYGMRSEKALRVAVQEANILIDLEIAGLIDL